MRGLSPRAHSLLTTGWQAGNQIPLRICAVSLRGGLNLVRRLQSVIQNVVQVTEIEQASLAPTVSLRELFRRFWPIVRSYRGRLAIVLVLAMIGPLLDTLAISLYGRLVDDVLVPRQLTMLAPIAAAYIGLTVIGGINIESCDYPSIALMDRLEAR